MSIQDALKEAQDRDFEGSLVDIAIKKQNIKSTTKKMTIEIYQAMMKSIKDGNKDLVAEHMNKYDMTKAQKDAVTKAINETA